jgi:hypothetical protein
MMFCQALMRHFLGTDYSINRIIKNKELRKDYSRVIKLILDNETGRNGAFSIQNVAKIGFCHNKLPGEWYGPHAISLMLKVLNS